jgi:hypothetical protein
VSPAAASLVALLIAIALSLTSRINVGAVAMVFAWIIGTAMAAMKAEEVAAGFPSPLFLTLVGVTLLFALADTNGTLERLANRAVRLARGNARLVPIVFFVIALALSSIGPGAVSSVALIIPLAMAIGRRLGVPLFLTALMVANGANAGNLSPISAVGIVANTKIAEAGIGHHETKVWLANLIAQAFVAAAAYVMLGVHRLSTEHGATEAEGSTADLGPIDEHRRRVALSGARRPFRSSVIAALPAPRRGVRISVLP